MIIHVGYAIGKIDTEEALHALALTPAAITHILEAAKAHQLGTMPTDGFMGPDHVRIVIGFEPGEGTAQTCHKPVVRQINAGPDGTNRRAARQVGVARPGRDAHRCPENSPGGLQAVWHGVHAREPDGFVQGVQRRGLCRALFL